MATLLRTVGRQGRLLTSNIARSRMNRVVACQISTSDKKKDVTVTSGNQVDKKSEELKNLGETFADADPGKEKNWVSYGFDYTDRDYDRFANNMTYFSLFTVGLCWVFFVFAYLPDHKLMNWSTREAYLEIERREREGLPLVDKNYIPPEQIELPSEEELGQTEIII